MFRNRPALPLRGVRSRPDAGTVRLIDQLAKPKVLIELRGGRMPPTRTARITFTLRRSEPGRLSLLRCSQIANKTRFGIRCATTTNSTCDGLNTAI